MVRSSPENSSSPTLAAATLTKNSNGTKICRPVSNLSNRSGRSGVTLEQILRTRVIEKTTSGKLARSATYLRYADDFGARGASKGA